jgi:hypothetical protein
MTNFSRVEKAGHRIFTVQVMWRVWLNFSSNIKKYIRILLKKISMENFFKLYED